MHQNGWARGAGSDGGLNCPLCTEHLPSPAQAILAVRTGRYDMAPGYDGQFGTWQLHSTSPLAGLTALLVKLPLYWRLSPLPSTTAHSAV